MTTLAPITPPQFVTQHSLLGFTREFAPPRTPTRFPGRTDVHRISTFGQAVATFGQDQLAQARAAAHALNQAQAGAAAIVVTFNQRMRPQLEVYATVDVVSSTSWHNGKPDPTGNPFTSIDPVSLKFVPKDATVMDFHDARLVELIDGDQTFARPKPLN